jgi:hypothetical protein
VRAVLLRQARALHLQRAVLRAPPGQAQRRAVLQEQAQRQAVLQEQARQAVLQEQAQLAQLAWELARAPRSPATRLRVDVSRRGAWQRCASQQSNASSLPLAIPFGAPAPLAVLQHEAHRGEATNPHRASE